MSEVVAVAARSPVIPAGMIARIVDVLHPEQLWLFGRRARGDARVDSDWDFMAVLLDSAPEQDLEIASVWKRLRDLRLQRVELFTMTRGDFDAWKGSLGTLGDRRIDWHARSWRLSILGIVARSTEVQRPPRDHVTRILRATW